MAGRHRGPSDPSARGPGKLFDIAGPRVQSRVARNTWCTTRAFRHGPECPRRAGRNHRPSDMGPSGPGQLVDRGRTDPGPSRPGPLVDPGGPRTQVRDAQENGWTPQDLGPGPESPCTVGRPHRPSDKGPSHTGQLVYPAGTRTWVESCGKLEELAGFRTRVESCGELVDTAAHRIRARFARDSWSNPQASDPGLSPLGLLVETVGSQTQAQVTREGWSTPQDLGPMCEWHGSAGRPRGP